LKLIFVAENLEMLCDIVMIFRGRGKRERDVEFDQ